MNEQGKRLEALHGKLASIHARHIAMTTGPDKGPMDWYTVPGGQTIIVHMYARGEGYEVHAPVAGASLSVQETFDALDRIAASNPAPLSVDRQDYAHTTQVVNRIIDEVAGTIRTNGIQELDHEQRGGMSTYLYVVDCLVATAYNAVRALPGFALSYGEFHARATARPQPTEADRGAARGVIAEMEHGPAASPEAQALLVLVHAADHLYNKSRWEDGDEQAIDLLDSIRADTQEAAGK